MGNGTVLASGLITVQGSIQLAADAGRAYLAFHAKYPGTTIAEPIGGYRDLPTQAKLKANPRAYGSLLPSSAIASPGSSTHGLGENVDLVGGSISNIVWAAAQFGFHQRDAAGDPHCFHYDGSYNPAPAALPSNDRAAAKLVNIRATPSSTAALEGTIASGQVVALRGFVHGEMYAGSDVWFVGGDSFTGYVWAGNFVDKGTHDLPDLSPATPPVVVTPPAVTTTPAPVAPSSPAAPVDVDPVITPADPQLRDPGAPSQPVVQTNALAQFIATVVKAIAAAFAGKK